MLHIQLSILLSQHCPLYLCIAATYKNTNIPICLEYLIKSSARLYNCNIKREISTKMGNRTLITWFLTWSALHSPLFHLRGTHLQHALGSELPKSFSKNESLGSRIKKKKKGFGEHDSGTHNRKLIRSFLERAIIVSSEVTTLSEITNHNTFLIHYYLIFIKYYSSTYYLNLHWNKWHPH